MPVILSWAFVKDFGVLQVLKPVINMYNESFDVVMNMVVDRHFKSWKLLPSVILSDTNLS